MRFTRNAMLTAVAVVLSVAQANAQNLLVNPGFEAPITSDGPPFVGFWEGFSGNAAAIAANSSASPRTGAQHLSLSITAVNDTFTGVFQDVAGLIAGQAVDFSVWHKRVGTLDLDAEVRIEWRNSVSNTEISRTPNSVPTAAITTDYTLFSLPSVVPLGADTARAVYAIQTFSGGPDNTGTVFIDDASFTAIPEPATLAMLGVAGLALVGVRRRLA